MHMYVSKESGHSNTVHQHYVIAHYICIATIAFSDFKRVGHVDSLSKHSRYNGMCTFYVHVKDLCLYVCCM